MSKIQALFFPSFFPFAITFCLQCIIQSVNFYNKFLTYPLRLIPFGTQADRSNNLTNSPCGVAPCRSVGGVAA